MRKALLALLFFVFGLFAFSSPASANFVEALQSNEYNLESFLGGKNLINPGAPSGVFPTIMNTLSGLAVGFYDENGNRIAKGGVSYIAETTDAMYSLPPVSGVNYMTYSFSKFSPVSPAYAASPGQNFLQPIIKLWELNRNIAYLFFIIIFVVTGFMIMFRTKLNPQTVVNLQLALPNIVVSLLLVTFSFAISGFIVDLVFWGNQFVHGVYGHIFGGAATADTYDVLKSLIDTGFGGGTSTFFTGVLDKVSSGIFSLITGAAFGDYKGLFELIVAFTLFGTALKIFFVLLSKYVLIIIQAAFSPLIFLFGALATSQKAFSSLFKSLLASALSFTGVYFVLIFAEAIATSIGGTTAHSIVGFQGLPPLNAGPGSAIDKIGGISAYAALGVLMTAPAVPQLIDKALGVQAQGPDTSGILGAIRKLPIIGGLVG